MILPSTTIARSPRPGSAIVFASRGEWTLDARAYDGGGLAKGGGGTLYYDGQKVGEGRVGRTVPMLFSADETTDIGREAGTPVTPDYNRYNSVFSGKINWVQIDLGKDDADHMISPEERLRVAMARQ